MVIASQCGKTEAVFDIMGERLDTSPVPIMYLGPTKQMITDQMEPRIEELLLTTSLRSKMAPMSKQKKTKKLVAGVPLRLAHGGSSAALKSDPFGLAITDEADELMANIKGAGNPLDLVDDRGNTYADFVHAVISTPSEGPLEVELDEESGLEFWADSEPEDIKSTIWRQWQSGTKHHWAWPCPHCSEYFIPRFSCLKWDKPVDASGRELSSTATLARQTAYLECPRCGGVIEDSSKEEMNAKGVFVSPGQSITPDGEVHGLPIESWTLSFWVSGLASPFVSWGDRAARYVTAVRSGDPESIKVVKNGSFAELYTPGGGSVPDWKEVQDCADDYPMGEVPEDAGVLTLCADVQADRIPYTVRGWGDQGTSWLVDAGELYGNTAEKAVWDDLANLVTRTYGGLPIRLALVDSGFRPGKKFVVPEHRVYAFARRFPKLVYATKGSSTPMRKPLLKSVIDVRVDGKNYKKGLELMRLDTDYLKSWVQQRVRWEKGSPGAWYVPSDVSVDFCKQIVSEARVHAPGGKMKWVPRSKENHFLDCFDAETELLTSDGWARVDALRDDMRFATVNLGTDLIEYQLPTKLISRRHTGEMISVSGRAVDLLVTPNHRMVTYRTNPATTDPSITLAKDLTIWHTLKRTATWRGEDLESVVLPATERTQAKEYNAGDVAELLGWYVSEGHCKVDKRTKLVIITQNPGVKQDEIRRLLSRMAINFTVTGGRQIRIASRQIFDLVQGCYVTGDAKLSYSKKVPEIVKSMAPAMINRFIDAAVKGDGWVQYGSRHYATVSKVLADGMQELFLKIGKSANVSVRKAKPYEIRGKSGDNTVDQYHVSEIKTAAARLRRSDNSPLVSTVAFDGMVYCASVPNGTLIARRGGKTVIVGNCEAMQAACFNMLNLAVFRTGSRRFRRATEPTEPTPQQPVEGSQRRRPKKGGWLDGESIW